MSKFILEENKLDFFTKQNDYTLKELITTAKIEKDRWTTLLLRIEVFLKVARKYLVSKKSIEPNEELLALIRNLEEDMVNPNNMKNREFSVKMVQKIPNVHNPSLYQYTRNAPTSSQTNHRHSSITPLKKHLKDMNVLNSSSKFISNVFKEQSTPQPRYSNISNSSPGTFDIHASRDNSFPQSPSLKRSFTHRALDIKVNSNLNSNYKMPANSSFLVKKQISQNYVSYYKNDEQNVTYEHIFNNSSNQIQKSQISINRNSTTNGNDETTRHRTTPNINYNLTREQRNSTERLFKKIKPVNYLLKPNLLPNGFPLVPNQLNANHNSQINSGMESDHLRDGDGVIDEVNEKDMPQSLYEHQTTKNFLQSLNNLKEIITDPEEKKNQKELARLRGKNLV